MPTYKVVVFLQNHDTQHTCGISYRDGDVFRIANVWMLAQGYGNPSILSSYAFDCPAGNSMGPPSDANGWTTAVSCAASLDSATVGDRKSTRLNSSHSQISYAVFCLKKKKKKTTRMMQ